jgi:hypothetical protein
MQTITNAAAIQIAQPLSSPLYVTMNSSGENSAIPRTSGDNKKDIVKTLIHP